MKWFDQISLNDNWLFTLGDPENAAKPGFDDAAFTPVKLPHDWQITAPRDANMDWGWSQGYYDRYQVCWYRLHFAARPEWKGRILRLLLDGCQRFYDVYLNGERIGGHNFGYVPCLIDLTGRLTDENVLAVRVNNADSKGDRWYSGAGLTRTVRLLVDDPVHIVPWSLFAPYDLNDANHADVHARLRLENRLSTPVDATLTLTLTAPDGSIAAQVRKPLTLTPGQTDATLDFALDHVLRWDVSTPSLYRMDAALDAAETHDAVTETLGFRTFHFDGDTGFTLNGRSMKLYGADLHHDAGAVFGAAAPRAIIRRRLERLQAMGCNAIRTSHNPHDEALYELCDELGLLMIDELYDKWTHSDTYSSRLHESDWQEDLTLMVERDRNHPSIILWSMGNELEVQYSEYFFTHFPEMKAVCLALDPTRPVTVVLVGFCGRDNEPLGPKLRDALRYNEMVDVFCGNYMENFYTAMREAGVNKAIIGTEVFSYYRHDELTATTVLAQSPWADVDERPYVAGGFVWAGVDYLGESTGYPCKGWPGCPIDSTGIWKLRAWHLYSQWVQEPVLRIGVYDGEHVPWDGSNSMWGFPPLSGHWSYRGWDRMQHVAVMTNCDEVRLYQNDDPVRICREKSPDRLFHLYVRYQVGGVLRAEGWKDGQCVIEQTLHTAWEPAKLELRLSHPHADEDGLVIAECWLLDEFGQPFELERPEVHFSVSGGVQLIGVDSGNLMDLFDPWGDCIRLNNGHAVAYLRLTGEQATLTAHCGSLSATAAVMP